MLSLGNVFNQEELFAFARRVEERLPNKKFSTMLSLSRRFSDFVWYENGVIVRMTWRWRNRRSHYPNVKPFVT